MAKNADELARRTPSPNRCTKKLVRAERLAASAAEMSMLVEQRTTTAIDALNASTRALEETFNAQSGVVGERTETLEKALALGVDNVRKALEESAGKLASTLRDRVTESRREIEEEANRIAALTGDTGSNMTTRIEEILRGHQESLTAGIASYEAQIGERTAALNDILENTTKPLVDRLADSGKGLADELEKATRSVTERLRHENTELVNMLATRTADTLTAVEGMQTNLSQGVGELIDRLSSSNSRLGELIELAATNIGSMDKRLDTTTDNFIDKVGGVAENLEKSISLLTTNTARLDDVSAKTLSDVASIASRFQEHGNVLATASDLLGTAQNSLTATLEDRSAALDQLASGLVGKSEEVQMLLRSFENVVTSTLQGVEQRALSSTDTMAASIRQTAEDAMARFDEATENMREIAANMRGEMQATRDEVRRGVMALPEETRESANAMRRAVSEQINALKDLSRIVEDSGRAFDINDGATRAKKPMTSAAATSRPSEVAPARSSSPTLSAPTMRGTVDTPPRVTQPASNGWVSDLLKRASQDELTPPQPQPRASAPVKPARAATSESLNNISADIARAIDNEAAMDLWERYRRGERNLFNRRLYTLRGQQTFDDMKRRYESDGNFATTVDRYITDFERLLEDVSRNDRDGAMALSYLTSDTGKVYTMLAHASGRLR
ncbi:MAG: hypothetical protein U5K75_05445 [Ahrensia sp.]|nr:hypothetical protein [Ahrensia sp.]